MPEPKKSWVRPVRANRPSEPQTKSASPLMSAETSLTEAPLPATASSPSLLPVVTEKQEECTTTECDHDHDTTSHGFQSHAHHDHAGGCCATTSPAAAAVAVEKANAAITASLSASSAESLIESPTASDAGESTVDDAALIEALREVIDPELMINIVDLGLVYAINHTDRKVAVDMTLTSPACPAGPQIIMQSKMALEKLDGVDVAEIKLVMSPPWTPARMTDEARDQLGIF
jgi:metal-sulfur cluster biosynthetic enzyme